MTVEERRKKMIELSEETRKQYEEFSVIMHGQPDLLSFIDDPNCTTIRNGKICKTYCIQNEGDCKTCSLSNYERDCKNNVYIND